MKYETLEEYTQKRMKNKNFAKEYEAIQPEMNIIRAIIDARTSRNLTQQELAELTGIDQATISKLENGTRNPSVKLLEKLANGMNTNLKIEFVPR
jgi:DNA-binding XRE family transcriptional regulator